VQGSCEAITGSLEKISTDEIKARVIHTGVGGITEGDITLAHASQALLVGFNVRPNPQARELAQKESIEMRFYSVIYDIVEDVKKILSGMLSPTIEEKHLGTAEVRQLFNVSKIGCIAGSFVTSGTIERNAKVRLLRNNVVIYEGTLKTLKRFKDDVKEAKEGYECGILLENYNDIHIGDTVECYRITEQARTL